MNSENYRIARPYRFALYLKDNLNLERFDKYIDFSNLSIYYLLKKLNEDPKRTVNPK